MIFFLIFFFLYAGLNSTNAFFIYVLFNVFASMPADRAQANQGVGKVPKRIPASLRETSARKPGKALSRTARWQNGV